MALNPVILVEIVEDTTNQSFKTLQFYKSKTKRILRNICPPGITNESDSGITMTTTSVTVTTTT